MRKDEAWLTKQAKRLNFKPVERVKNAPELFRGLELYLQAFMELTSCRGMGYGSIGPIPWMAIHTYGEAAALDGEQREDLFYYVQRLDKVYMEWQTKKAEKEREQQQREAEAKAKQTKGRKR